MKNRLIRNDKINSIKLMGIFILGICFYYVFLGNFDSINSDSAYYAIAGKDIMDGNVLLRGWYGATNTFYFLSLVYGIFGKILGFNIHLIYFVSALEWGIFSAVLMGIILKYNKQSGTNRYISVILALMMCFSSNYIYQQIKILGGVHLDVLLISIPFILCLINNIECGEIRSKWKLITASICMIVAIFSDSLTIYFVVFPMIIFLVIKIVRRDEGLNKKIVFFNLCLMVGIVILEKIWYFFAKKLGAINVLWSYGEISVVSKDELFNRLAYFVEEILYIFNADIFSKTIKFNNFLYFANFILLLISIVGVIVNFKLLIKKSLNQFLLIIIIVESCIFLFSDYLSASDVMLYATSGVAYTISGVEYSTRVMYFIFSAYLIMVGQIDWDRLAKKLNVCISLKKIVICILGFALVIFGLNIKNIDIGKKDISGWKKVVDVLENNNLKRGYGTFWLANITTLASECEIYVNPLCNGNDLSKFKWLSFDTNRWNYANFILIDDSKWDNVTRDTIVDSIGEPDREILVEGTTISVLIYDKNIMPYINDSGEERQIDSWWDIVNSDNGKKELEVNNRHFSSWFEADESGEFTSSGEGMLIYGPYKRLDIGTYDITFSYSLKNDFNNDDILGWADIYSAAGKVQNQKIDIISSTGSVTLKNVEVQEECDDVELRMYTTVAGVTADKIEIRKH